MVSVFIAISDESVRKTCHAILEAQDGYTVTEASNGLIAFTRLLSSPEPLVVLLDTWLDGRDAAGQLLRLAAAGEVMGRHHYIVCSTRPIERSAPELAPVMDEIGAFELPMPFGIDELLAAVACAASFTA